MSYAAEAARGARLTFTMEVVMSARGEVLGGLIRRRMMIAALVLVAALLALAPRDVRGQTWKDCVDGSFAGYNECLTGSSGWFDRKLCDISWEFEVALCTAQAVGEIRHAWSGA